MKEKVFGALMMFVIAVVVLTSATFAWITLSTSPEVSAIDTTVSANGNLEIALAHGKASDVAFPTSGRGDSSANENTSVVASNITWGNLVNLSDESYGIQGIALRPAMLNDDSLLYTPLYGAAYSWDGRITSKDSDYTFAKWNGSEFTATNEVGVRAISSYKLGESSGALLEIIENQKKWENSISVSADKVSKQYATKVLSGRNISGLQGLLSTLVNGKADESLNGAANATDNADVTPYIPYFYNIYNELVIAMDYQKDVYTELANYQRYIDTVINETSYAKELSWDEIELNKSKYNVDSVGKVSTDKVVCLPALNKFITDYNDTVSGRDLFYELDQRRQAGETFIFSDVDDELNKLVGTSKVTVNGTPISSIGTSEAMGMVNNAQVEMRAGIFCDFEFLAVQSAKRLDKTMNVPADKIPVYGGLTDTHVYTSASQFATTPGPKTTYIDSAITHLKNSSNLTGGVTKIATDNYGLAIDLWFRTNIDDTYLVLDGEVEQVTSMVRATGTDDEGATVDLYETEITGSEGSETIQIYKKNDKWYKNGTAEEVTVSGTPKELFKEVTTVTGYEGSNRIWDEDDKPLITPDSTTQGIGSCYVFYTTAPEEQARIINLLEAFRVAFVSSDGKLLAEATLDTDNYYAVSGKVTIPLVIKTPTKVLKLVQSVDGNGNPVTDNDGNPVFEEVYETAKDKDGKDVYGITELKRNAAQMITAIIYIDGEMLSNEDVLAASNIQGQLNFQFASSEKLVPAGNTALESAERRISATADKDSFEYGVDDLDIHVTVTVEGEEPSAVSASFMRAINSTQGKRMDAMTFEKGSNEGEWIATYVFPAPGEYYIREVQLDGINYSLAEPIHATVSGFAPIYVNWDEVGNSAVVYTTRPNYSERLYISFGSDASIVNTTDVKLQFVDGNNQYVNAKMSYDPINSQWTGVANFGKSGTYTLKYVVVDNEAYDLEQYRSSFVKTLTVYMGLSAEVTLTNPTTSTSDFYVSGQTFSKGMTVTILDDSGSRLETNLGAVLAYSKGGSTTDTVEADLEWNAEGGSYSCELPFTSPGSYQFAYIKIGGSKITSASDTPVFIIKNPNPVSYDESSVSTYHGEDIVQYAPITNDAFIGPIKIENSDTAYISAVVHNSITGEDYTITQTTNNLKKGAMYYNRSAWYINLPTYRLELNDGSLGEPTQEGEWTVKSISLWDVLDTNEVQHTISNKLVWTDGVDYDFSPLSTVVSCSMNVNMALTGSPNFGSDSAPFMKSYNVAEDAGITISIVDDAGRAIPSSKISDISLNLNYVDNTKKSYGYEVKGYSRKPKVVFNTPSVDAEGDETGTWTASQDLAVQYVGEYTVTNLTLTMSDGSTIEIGRGEHGVPEKFTVTSAGPENNVECEVRQNRTVLGMEGTKVTGRFLDVQNPGITVTAQVKYTDAQGNDRIASYVKLDDFGVKLHFSYKNGKNAPYGGYSWSGGNTLEDFDMQLVAGENTQNGIPYNSTSMKMLAGSYGVSGTITLNGSTIPINYSFSDIEVHSVSPTVSVAGVSPSPSEEIYIYHAIDTKDYFWNDSKAEEVKNFYKSNFVNAYISASEDGQTIDDGEGNINIVVNYTAPTVTLTLADLGSQFNNASLYVPNDASSSNGVTYTFNTSTYTVAKEFGYVEQKTDQNSGCLSSDEFTYEIPYCAGTQVIDKITVTDTSGVSYSVNLRDTVTFRQTNDTPPSISFEKKTGYTMPQGQISEDGMPFDFVLPTDIGTTTYDKVEATGDADWTLVSSTTKKMGYISGVSFANSSSGTCSKTYYSTPTFTVATYNRTTSDYSKTTNSATYRVTDHVIGWYVNGVFYNCGDTVTVDGVMTVVAVTGEKYRTKLNESVVTFNKTEIIDVATNPATTTVKGSQASSTISKEAADATARTYWPTNPSGFSWGNTSDPWNSDWVTPTLTIVSETSTTN